MTDSELEQKWIVIGISGATCSGKSTLSKKLHNIIVDSVLITQDDYFLDPNSDEVEMIPELNHGNWEIMSSIDHKSLHAKIVDVCNSRSPRKPGILIVDGHIIFNIPSISKLFHKKYFLTLNKEECWQRRRVRVYNPADPPGYFEKCVWPMYLQHKEEMDKTNIVYIDGELDLELILKYVADDMEASLAVKFLRNGI